MAKKRKVGRPKMAENELKTAFPLRLRPALIKEIKREAKEWNMKPGQFVEKILDEEIYYPISMRLE